MTEKLANLDGPKLALAFLFVSFIAFVFLFCSVAVEILARPVLVTVVVKPSAEHERRLSAVEKATRENNKVLWGNEKGEQ